MSFLDSTLFDTSKLQQAAAFMLFTTRGMLQEGTWSVKDPRFWPSSRPNACHTFKKSSKGRFGFRVECFVAVGQACAQCKEGGQI